MDSRDLATRLAQLSPAKRALLEAELKQQELEINASLTIPRRSTGDQAPLSFAQRRLWFLNQLEPDNPNYNESSALRLTGRLDSTALQKALNRLVTRHEVLRATISNRDGVSIQTIRQPQRVELEIVDLRQIDARERVVEAERRLLSAVRRPFDLTADLMLRPLLVRLDEQEHILLLVTHHIASDGWSANILWRELGEFYRAETLGVAPHVAELPIQYQDYAAWQHQWFSDKHVQGQLAFWKNHLEGLRTLRLPTDRPVPLERHWHGARTMAPLEASLCDSIAAFSRAHGVTQFMTFVAAFQVLLHRYSGQNDIAIGTPIAGRNRTEVEGLVGFFVNTLILRTDLSGNPTFVRLLGRVRDVALDAYNNQDIPFEKLVEELNPQRSLSQTPLFNILFAYQNMATPMPQLPGLTHSAYEIFNGSAKCDFYLSVVNREQGPLLRAVYDTDLFDESKVRRILGHYQTLLRALTTDPACRIDEVPILSDAEKQQLLVDWNRTDAAYPADSSISRLFERQVEKNPDAVALIGADQTISYSELNRQANRLAHHLQHQGMPANGRVGICMERSVEAIVAMLAILKAGCAYLPLDPSYPSERLRFMVDDTQTQLVLTQENTMARAAAMSTRTLCVDSAAGEIDKCSAANLAAVGAIDDTAYIIYTSGSSGQPKAVEVAHRGVVRLLFGVDYVTLDAQQTLMNFAPLSFDASTFEIWAALLHGAKCVIAPPTLLGVHELGALLERHRVSIVWLTASLFNLAIDHAPQLLSGVRQLLIGGEALSLSHVKRALAALPQTQIINGYGPTENTTFTCCYPIPRQLDDRLVSVPIGRPIGNTQVYLLDQSLNPVPAGVAGELCIAGDGLAKGYVNRPELTAEKFVFHSVDGGPAKRLYKSGDMARYLADGNIEFLGRRDGQVKLRGFRIELGEIETVLGRHPAVREVVVDLREVGAREKQLVAYIMPLSTDPAPSTAALSTYLRDKLPDYMVPSAYMILQSLPLNANGKVDRSQLPASDCAAGEPVLPNIAPQTAKEILVWEVWTEVLPAPLRSVHDNFFELGGHSLLGMELISRLQKQFQREIPLRWLFESPTVAGLAARLDAAPQNGAAPAGSLGRYLFELKPGKGKPPVFLLPGGFGGDEAYLCYARLAYHVGADYPFYGLRAPSAEGEMAAHRSVEAMALDYLNEIRSRQPHGPYSIMGNCIGGALAYEIARQLLAHGENCNLVLLDSFCPTRINYYRYLLHEYGRRLDRFFRDRRRSLAMRIRQAVMRPQLSTSGKSHNQRIRRLQRQQESYVQTLRGYRPRPYKGQISLIYNENAYAIDPRGGWTNLVSGDVASYCAKGNHESYIRGHVQSLAKLVRQCLEKT
jgi:amino acid adenylation domain-containing protein